MQTINPNLHPKTGFVFKEKDGTTIAGNTWAGVAARLAAYRKRNNYPPGDPINEVQQQACEKNPSYCVEESAIYRQAVKVVSLKSKILAWFSAMKKQNARKPLQFVDDNTYLHRAGVCINCPHRRALEEGCSSCKAAVRELRADIIGGRSSHQGLVDHGCGILGVDLATAVHLDEPTVENPELPGHCWHKRGI